MEDAVAKREALARDLAAKGAEVERLTAEVTQLRKGPQATTASSAAPPAASSEEVEALKRSLQSAQAQITALQGSTGESGKAAAEAARLQLRVKELEDQAQSQATELRTQSAASAATIARLEATASAAQRQAAEASAAVGSTSEEATQRATKLSAQLADREARVAELTSQVNSLTAEAVSLRSAAKDSSDASERQRATSEKMSSDRIIQLSSEVQQWRAKADAAAAAAAKDKSDVATQLADAQSKHAAALAEEAAKVTAAQAGFSATLEKERAAHAAALQAETAKVAQRYEAQVVALKKLVTTARSASAGTAALVQRLRPALAAVVTMQKTAAANMREMQKFLGETVRAVYAATRAEIMKQADAVAALQARYKKEVAERRRLHNLVQELRGNIRVYCRSRPALPFELEGGATVAVGFPEDGEIQVVNSKRQVKTWEFDRVFRPADSNEAVFKETEDLITSAMDGYNVCIFAYGQTGSGKTFTMEGTEESRGVNYRALATLFAVRDERRADMGYEISVAMLEIYNENIQDMLAARVKGEDVKLAVREAAGGGVFVPDLTVKQVESLDDVLKIMRQGYKNRTTFATNMNEHSSRSHCMLSVYITGAHRVTGQVNKGKLHLVDLAGSERVSKSGVTGDRLKEAQNINRSLSALGDVIQARAEKQKHVPYRNSTLTFLLSDSLAGDSKTLMFVNLSPISSNSEETFCSLNFAARVRAVELGKASKHVSKGAAGAGVARALPGPGGVDSPVEGDDAGEDWGVEDGGAEDAAAATPTNRSAPAPTGRPSTAATASSSLRPGAGAPPPARRMVATATAARR